MICWLQQRILLEKSVTMSKRSLLVKLKRRTFQHHKKKTKIFYGLVCVKEDIFDFPEAVTMHGNTGIVYNVNSTQKSIRDKLER